MATQIIDGKRFLLRQVPKTSSRPVDEYSSKIPSNIVPPPALSPPPPPSKSSTTQSTNNTLIARTEVTPATRIVVVRTANSTQNEKEETIETNESARSKSVELPPMLTNGVSISIRNSPIKNLYSSVHLFILFDDLFRRLNHQDQPSYLSHWTI
jgi:hypothetical protein